MNSFTLTYCGAVILLHPRTNPSPMQLDEVMYSRAGHLTDVVNGEAVREYLYDGPRFSPSEVPYPSLQEYSWRERIRMEPTTLF